ncbi:ABC transporter substrate-binding protein [Fodinicola acaciae]|uniref:ABC transporter substrate-binding protein n=1 Tax=Fodinicola acaciae TaxID=2681555 RepID=UPI0013D00C55|nr:ABC transporter substrate-binding protein [Fodinicola acaciae]
MTLRKKRAIQWFAAGAVVALLASACGTPGSETGGSGDEKVQRGGTLTLLDLADFEHLDPRRNYVASQLQLEVLYAPTLVSYKNATGSAGTEIGADAATDTGTKNADATQWTFTIRKNLKWQDGKAVTCQDFKYGIESSFSDVLTDGPAYQKQYLKGGLDYKGIYLDPKGLDSIKCDGDKISFTLARPIADFNYALTMGIFAAVRKDKDTKEKYDQQPFSYGPYMIKSHVRDQSLELVRNPYWSQADDQIRKNNPDNIKFTFGLDQAVIADRLIQDKAADQRTATFGNTQVPAQNVQQVLNDPKLKARTFGGIDPYVWYVAVNTAKVKDLKCRQAYQYATNKRTYLTAIGGDALGQYATSILSPTMKSYKEIDPYGLKDKPEGDPAKAKQLLAQSPTCPKNIKLDYSQTPTGDKIAASIKEAFARAGITVTANPIARKQYYSTIGKPAIENELAYAAWGADFPRCSSVIPPLFDGTQIPPAGNQNFAQLNDPAINQGIKESAAQTDPQKAEDTCSALDLKVQQTGAIIPLRYEKALFMRGSKVTGAQMNAEYSDISLLNVGVAPGNS